MTGREELTPNVIAERFETSRPRLLAIATRLLGSRADAEDVMQEAWLRVQRSDTTVIENLDAWLTTVVSRLCLDLLRSPRRTREHSWNVEPWTEDSAADSPDPADVVAEADQVGLALFIVLETLQPAERIAFVLHDVFGRSFADIAEVVDRSPQAARQLASRARRRLREGSTTSDGDRRHARSLVDAWLLAVQGGDLRALLAVSSRCMFLPMLDHCLSFEAETTERPVTLVVQGVGLAVAWDIRIGLCRLKWQPQLWLDELSATIPLPRNNLDQISVACCVCRCLLYMSERQTTSRTYPRSRVPGH